MLKNTNTKAQTIAMHRKMWNWIADKTEEWKDVVLEKDYLHTVGAEILKSTEGWYRHIFCCNYANRDCSKCPLKWTQDHCYSMYSFWESALLSGNIYLAADSARKIANVPEAIYIGDKVACDLGVGVVTGKDNGRFCVTFPNRYSDFFNESEIRCTDEEMQVEFKDFSKHDLIPGKHMVETCKCRYLLIENNEAEIILVSEDSDPLYLSDYNVDLTNAYNIDNHIIAVYEISNVANISDIFKNLKIIWKRKKKRLTIEEVSSILGYQIEIVD